MIIKICGLNITRDVQLCIDLGINLLGFVFYKKSPRNINLEDVKIFPGLTKKFFFCCGYSQSFWWVYKEKFIR